MTLARWDASKASRRETSTKLRGCGGDSKINEYVAEGTQVLSRRMPRNKCKPLAAGGTSNQSLLGFVMSVQSPRATPRPHTVDM